MRKMNIFILVLLFLILADLVTARVMPPLCDEEDPVPMIKLAIKQYVEYAPNAPYSKEEIKGMIRDYIMNDYVGVCSLFEDIENIVLTTNCSYDGAENYSTGVCHPVAPTICLDGDWVEDQRLCCHQTFSPPITGMIAMPPLPTWVDMDGIFPGCECYWNEMHETSCADGSDNDCDGNKDLNDRDCWTVIEDDTEDEWGFNGVDCTDKPVENAVDEDWDIGLAISNVGQGCNVSINYTIPASTLSAVNEIKLDGYNPNQHGVKIFCYSLPLNDFVGVQIIKSVGVSRINVTIPSYCLNGANKLALKYLVWGGNGWVNFIEEKVFWNVTI